MKTMTCRDLGGPCDEELHGDTVEKIVDAGTNHLKAMTDEAHMAAKKMMEDAANDVAAAGKWFADVKAKFDAMPEG